MLDTINHLDSSVSMANDERRATYMILITALPCVGTLYLVAFLVHVIIRTCVTNSDRNQLRVISPSLKDNYDTHGANPSPTNLLIPQCYDSLRKDIPLYGQVRPIGESLISNYYNPTVLPASQTADGQSHELYIQNPASHNHSVPGKRLLLFVYLSFRVFYTFLFTFSVAVSLIFSVQPSVRTDELTTLFVKPSLTVERSPSMSEPTLDLRGLRKQFPVNLRQRLSSPLNRIRQNAILVEALLEQELTRQLEYVERIQTACQHAVSVEITEALNEMTQSVSETLLVAGTQTQERKRLTNDDLLNLQSVVSSGIDCAKQHIENQRSIVENFRTQVERQLDLRHTTAYVNLKTLLERSYESNWLHYVQQMVNSSQQLKNEIERYTARNEPSIQYGGASHNLYSIAQQSSGLDHKQVEFMVFMGLRQVENVHVLPRQLLNEFKRLMATSQYQPQLNIGLQESHVKTSKPSLHLSDNVGRLRKSVPAPSSERQFFSHSDLENVDVVSDGPHNERAETPSPIGSRFSYWPVKSFAVLPLSLTEIRLILLLIDCFIIIGRFYHTYLILRYIWLGQPLYVDASSLLISSTGTRDQCNSTRTGTSSTTILAVPTSGSNRVKSNQNQITQATYLEHLAVCENRYDCSHQDSSREDHPLLMNSETNWINETAAPSVLRCPYSTDQQHDQQSPVLASNSVSGLTRSSPSVQRDSTLKHCTMFKPLLIYPPISVFGNDQNASCLVGVRNTCCRSSHYISAVIGFTVLLACFGILIMQEQRIQYQSSASQLNRIRPVSGRQRASRTFDLASYFMAHYDRTVEVHAQRLNNEWLTWTQKTEVTKRRRLLDFSARFRHEMRQLYVQFATEIEINKKTMRSLGAQNQIKSSTGFQNWSIPSIVPPLIRLNSEILFRQPICHFLPVVPTRLSSSLRSIPDKNMRTMGDENKPPSVKNLLWIALINKAVDSNWNSLDQVRYLTVTSIVVSVIMLGCVGFVDILGWIFRSFSIIPARGISNEKHSPTSTGSSADCQLPGSYFKPSKVVLVSSQPPPVIPIPCSKDELDASKNYKNYSSSSNDAKHIYMIPHSCNLETMLNAIPTSYSKATLIMSPITLYCQQLQKSKEPISVVSAHADQIQAT